MPLYDTHNHNSHNEEAPKLKKKDVDLQKQVPLTSLNGVKGTCNPNSL